MLVVMTIRNVIRGVSRLFNAQRVDRDLDDEIQQYIDAAADDYVHSGMRRNEALRRARLDFLGVENAKENIREVGGSVFWRSLAAT